MDIADARRILIYWMLDHGATPEDAEDGAHNVIVRALKGNGVEHGAAYWRVAAENEARNQARRRRLFVPWGEGYDVREEAQEPEPDLSGLNLAADELAWLLAYHSEPRRWGFQHRKRDNVRACRLRKKARAA